MCIRDRLVVSFNPGYQSILKDLKQSTRQRFLALDFAYPEPEAEAEIIEREAGVDAPVAESLVELASMIRNLRDHGLEEGVSTRLLVYAARLINEGVPARRAAEVTMTRPLTDDADMLETLRELVEAVFEE